MRIAKSIILLVLLANFTAKISAQDSTTIQDPQPVVITQEGYSQQPNPEDVPLNERSFRQRLKLGGGISNIQLGNPTMLGLSPMLGYQATNKMIVGVGISYIYIRFKDQLTSTKYRTDLASYRGFMRYDLAFLQKLIGQGFFTAEVEQYRGIQIKQKYTPAIMAGLGMGLASGFGLTVLYDFNYNANSSLNFTTNSPWVIRVNGFF